MASADLGKVAQIDPESGEDYRLRGMAFVLKGEDDHAIAEYSRWIEVSPNNAQPTRRVGRFMRAKATMTEPLPTRTRH